MSFRLSYVLQIRAVPLNHVDGVFSVTGQVRFYGARFTGGKEGICSESVRNVGTRSAKKKTFKKHILRSVGFCLYILYLIRNLYP